nr:MAG TPA: hypothetical protein [Caudoviricetes sp.]
MTLIQHNSRDQPALITRAGFPYQRQGGNEYERFFH